MFLQIRSEMNFILWGGIILMVVIGFVAVFYLITEWSFRKKYRMYAEQFLKRARESRCNDFVFQLIRDNATWGNFSLSDIGTSEYELKELAIQSADKFLNEYRNALKDPLRNNDSRLLKSLVLTIQGLSQWGEFSLDSIGTNDRELDCESHDQKLYHRNNAVKFLEDLRDGVARSNYYVLKILGELNDANLSLEDAGTSLQELEKYISDENLYILLDFVLKAPVSTKNASN